MNKIAEDIIFLKDNWGKFDIKTYHSIYNKENDMSKKSNSQMRKKLIISSIIVFLLFLFFKEYEGRMIGLLYSLLAAPIVYTVISMISQHGLVEGVQELIGTLVASVATGFVVALISVLIIRDDVKSMIFAFIVIDIVWLLGNIYYEKSKKPIVMESNKEDTLTRQLCEVEKKYGILGLGLSRPEFFDQKDSYFSYYMSFVMNRIDNSVEYPAPKIPELKMYKDILEGVEISSLLKSVSDSENTLKIDAISGLLKRREEELFVNNEEREIYLKTVESLLNKIPKFKFNIDEVSEINKPLLEGKVSYPKFYEAVTPIIESDAYKTIKNLNAVYKANFIKFNNDLKGTLIGANGEREVLKTLTDFAEISGKDKIRILPNIRLEPNGKSVESDFIVVCPNGVFALEVKNLGSTGSYNITVEKDGLWKKVMKNGRWKQMPDSISRQNERHLMGIEQVINSQMGNSTESWIEAKSLIVFANNVVGIRNYSNNVIIRDSEIMTEIRKHPICLNEQQIKKIADILLSESLPAKKYKMENWMTKLVGVQLELVQRTQDIYPYLQNYIEIMRAYNYKIYYLGLLPDYQVVPEEISLADDEREYQKSVEELEQEKKEEQERKIEEERRIRERAENFINNNQSAYGDQSYEQRYFDYDAYMRGEIHSVYSEDTRK